MPSKIPEMTEINAKVFPPFSPSFSTPSTTLSVDEPPPPYASHPTNPGFCTNAFNERQANKLPGGGMPSAEYFLPCTACSYTCSDAIPPAYRAGWEWIDPSINFRWESHTGCANFKGEKRELLGCWVCWEWEGKWVKPMEVEEWYAHMRKHWRTDGYKICVGKKGIMQRRRNCTVQGCPKVHS